MISWVVENRMFVVDSSFFTLFGCKILREDASQQMNIYYFESFGWGGNFCLTMFVALHLHMPDAFGPWEVGDKQMSSTLPDNWYLRSFHLFTRYCTSILVFIPGFVELY